MMTARHALPLHASVFGIHRLPANHGWLRLWLVQVMPMPLPSARLSTFVYQAQRASHFLTGVSTWKPMNDAHGAFSLKRQKDSSSGRAALGIGLELTT